MPYFVDISEGPVTAFLENEENVLPAMRGALENSLEFHLGQMGDHYCLTETYRIHGTSRIQFQLIIMDPDTQQFRGFRIIASDESAAAGVLRVIYIDEFTA